MSGGSDRNSQWSPYGPKDSSLRSGFVPKVMNLKRSSLIFIRSHEYCYACGHATGGEPLFCNSCGRSYDVKLCPRLHVNPRLAETCSQCGSRDLSIPQPRVPLAWRIIAFLVQAIAGLLLLLLSTPVALELGTLLLTRSKPGAPLMFSAFLLVVSRFFWAALPMWFRRIIHSALIRKNGDT